MLKLDNVGYVYNKNGPFEKIFLNNINIKIQEDILCVAGINGSGKSALIDILAGLSLPTTGSVYLDDVKISKKNITLLRKRASVFFQQAKSQILCDTMMEEYIYTLEQKQLNNKEKYKRKFIEMLDFLAIEKEFLNKPVLMLTERTLKILLIAMILVLGEEMIVLDDPFVGLDGAVAKKIIGYISHLYKEKKRPIIITTTDLEFIFGLCNRFVIINSGIIQFAGDRYQLIDNMDTVMSFDVGFPKISMVMKKYDNKYVYTIKEAKENINKGFGG